MSLIKFFHVCRKRLNELVKYVLYSTLCTNLLKILRIEFTKQLYLVFSSLVARSTFENICFGSAV